MAHDAFILVHAQEGPTRVNTHRILCYRPMRQSEQTQIVLNVQGLTLVVSESVEEVDALLMVAKAMEEKAKEIEKKTKKD